MNKTNNSSALITIGVLFFIFGFVTWLNGILIPFLKQACQLTDLQSYFVATAFFAAYFFMSLPSSLILEKLGTKKGMAFGLLIMAIGTLIFLPAANTRNFNLFLIGLFTQGTGLALLQTASNPYVSILGPIESAAQRISIMGICNKLAGIIGNLIFGSILLKNVDSIQSRISDATVNASEKNDLLVTLVSRINTPYTIMALFLIVMAIWIFSSKLPDIKEKVNEAQIITDNSPITSAQKRQIIFGFIAIFLYVAAEVMAGDLITTYGKNLGFTGEESKYFTSFGLIGLLVGYVVSIILIPKYVKQEVWLSVCTILGLGLSIASVFVDEHSTVFCLASLGFANAVMWPAIFPLGVKDLGRFTNFGSAVLIMGIVGGALMPPFYGWLYEKSGIGLDFRSAFALLMMVCYLYILWFGMKGHKQKIS